MQITIIAETLCFTRHTTTCCIWTAPSSRGICRLFQDDELNHIAGVRLDNCINMCCAIIPHNSCCITTYHHRAKVNNVMCLSRNARGCCGCSRKSSAHSSITLEEEQIDRHRYPYVVFNGDFPSSTWIKVSSHSWFRIELVRCNVLWLNSMKTHELWKQMDN